LREYPNSSFNCKFNIGVILFKLGLFKEALQCYQDLEKIEPLDKRICYNKAISELQNGKYNQCIITIDSYISDYNQRKEKFQKTKRGDKTLSYQERIQMQKENYVPDSIFLYEIYQIRGVACLRAKRVVEASKSFAVA
jgi:tetratricopeptide (TPR) repeat protein